MWELLINNIAKKGIRLTEEDISFMHSVFEHKKFRKHQYIVQQGDVCRYNNFIVKGLTRTYSVDEKGQEHILRFAVEEWWTGDLASFLTGKPSTHHVDCLEDTEVLRIGTQNLDTLFHKAPVMNTYFRQVYQGAIIAYSQRLDSILSKSNLERYQEFIERYPHIEQRISNNHVASYLGITPQSLSRIRSRKIPTRRT